jgi:hypothetical protein
MSVGIKGHLVRLRELGADDEGAALLQLRVSDLELGALIADKGQPSLMNARLRVQHATDGTMCCQPSSLSWTSSRHQFPSPDSFANSDRLAE